MKCGVILLALVALAAAKKDYSGYKKVTITSDVSNHPRLMKQLHEQYIFFSPKMFIVPPENGRRIEWLLKGAEIKFTMEENVQKNLEEMEAASQLARSRRPSQTHDWTAYSTYEEILDWMIQVASDFPDRVSIVEVGLSYEGRQLLALSINPSQTTTIWIDAGIHAREWATPAVATYIINELTYNYENNQEVADAFNWFILPISNPDGYAFSWASDRFWRKTRSVASNGCVGTDPNRNFGFHWGEQGSSPNPCSEIYAGSSAFSEVETAAMRDSIWAMKDDLAMYMSIHTYAQVVVSPWAYTYERPDDFEGMKLIGDAIAEAMTQENGELHEFWQSTYYFGPTAGGSDDWAKGEAGIDLSYLFELRPDGFPGFDLPPAEILPASTETWAGIKTAVSFVM